jgi:hypothetical protein
MRAIDGPGGRDDRPRFFSIATPGALLFVALMLLAAFLLLFGPVRCSSPGSGRSGYPSLKSIQNQYVLTFGGGIGGVIPAGATPALASRVRAALADSQAAEEAAIAAGGKIGFRYHTAVIGFSATLPPAALAAVMRAKMANPPLIERNWQAAQPPTRIEGRGAGILSLASQTGSPPLSQGLDRIDQRYLELNGEFKRPVAGAAEVHVFVIDSGILARHSQFRRSGTNTSRVGYGATAFKDPPTRECMRHGTHVAGTIGGINSGVAPNVILHSVRVIDCDENVTLAAAVAAVNWVTSQYLALHKPAVVNMSLEFDTRLIPPGEPKLPTLERAIGTSIGYGITYVVAAGNDSTDACVIAPARTNKIPPMGANKPITVGSMDPNSDWRADTSNFGSCVDLFAPGEAIVSADSLKDDGWAAQDGTSSAAPHVAGVAALFLSSHPSATPAQVWGAILNAADTDETEKWCGILDQKGPPNVLLHWGVGSADGTMDSENSAQPPSGC